MSSFTPFHTLLLRSLKDIHTPYYYALGADNRLLRVNVAHVAGVLDGPEGEIDSQDAEKIMGAVQRVRAVDWVNMSRECGVCVVCLSSIVEKCVCVI